MPKRKRPPTEPKNFEQRLQQQKGIMDGLNILLPELIPMVMHYLWPWIDGEGYGPLTAWDLYAGSMAIDWSKTWYLSLSTGNVKYGHISVDGSRLRASFNNVRILSNPTKAEMIKLRMTRKDFYQLQQIAKFINTEIQHLMPEIQWVDDSDQNIEWRVWLSDNLRVGASNAYEWGEIVTLDLELDAITHFLQPSTTKMKYKWWNWKIARLTWRDVMYFCEDWE